MLAVLSGIAWEERGSAVFEGEPWVAVDDCGLAMPDRSASLASAPGLASCRELMTDVFARFQARVLICAVAATGIRQLKGCHSPNGSVQC